jgi:hypothetical protein
LNTRACPVDVPRTSPASVRTTSVSAEALFTSNPAGTRANATANRNLFRNLFMRSSLGQKARSRLRPEGQAVYAFGLGRLSK